MTDAKRIRDKVIPVHAQADQAVDIHWRLEDGSTYVDRHRLPLKRTSPVKRPKGPTHGRP